MKINGRIGLSALALACGVSAFAQNDHDNNYLGVEGGFYFPVDTKIKDAFGSSIPKIGFSYGNVGRTADKWRMTAAFNFVTASKNGNRFFLLPVTAAMGRVFGQPGDAARPFVRVGVGAAYMDYGITDAQAVRHSGRKVLPTAAAEAGMIFGDRVRLSATYNWFQATDGFNFSGVQLTLGINVLKF
jgi:hypothetical protein